MDRKIKNRRYFKISMLLLCLAIYIVALFSPIYNLEARKSPVSTEDNYIMAKQMTGTYTCGEVFWWGVSSLPKDVARLIVTGDIHFRALWTILNIVFFISAFSLLRTRQKISIQIAMFVSVIIIFCFLMYGDPDKLSWAWDWPYSSLIIKKQYGYHLWFISFILLYIVISIERHYQMRMNNTVNNDVTVV